MRCGSSTGANYRLNFIEMKNLMLGNKAVAQGLYEAGVKFVSSYPGTPSTEITEFATAFDEIYTE